MCGRIDQMTDDGIKVLVDILFIKKVGLSPLL